MQGAPRPEAIQEWLQREMGYPGPLPRTDLLQKMSRGNMAPVWAFFLQRVRSEKTVATVRRNVVVHGLVGANSGFEKREKGRSDLEEREAAMRERDAAEEEAVRLRAFVGRKRRELRGRMSEISKEEAERRRLIDERSNARQKLMILEAYNQQCDEASRIFAEYQKRLQYYVDQAKNISLAGDVGNAATPVCNDAVYSTVKGKRASEDIILVETALEKNIRGACETLAAKMVEKISRIFPAYEGTGLHLSAQVDASKLGIDLDGELPEDVQAIALDALKNPSRLLQAVTLYTTQVKSLLRKETEKIDVKADAKLLRYKYEDDRIVDVTSPDSSSQLKYQVYGSGKLESDLSIKGIGNQLLDKEKEHVQQFIATEDSLNKAAEAKSLSQKLIKRLHGNNDLAAPQPIAAAVISQNIGNTRHFELDVLAKEREAAGLRASVSTLLSEVQRLTTLCEERREAGEALKKKWKKIEEFDARRSELEAIYSALLEANASASSFWSKQPSAAREYASKTIIPACDTVEVTSVGAKDLIEKEISSFSEALDNSLFMLPSTPQALLESMGIKGSSGQDAVSAAEKNASLLITRAGSGDPSALPSISRISTALQSHSGLKNPDAALQSVLEALKFCLMPRASEASILEELCTIINLVHTRRELVENDRLLLNHANRLQQGYERKTNYCLNLAVEQERLLEQRWLPELTESVLNTQKGLEDCQRIRGLVDEWWEQPAATVVDWVLVDGQNVAAWLNHVRQIQMAFYDQ